MARPSKLRAARNRSGLSTKEFAEKAGYAVQSIRNYESGNNKPTQPVLERYSEICGVPVEELRVKK